MSPRACSRELPGPGCRDCGCAERSSLPLLTRNVLQACKSQVPACPGPSMRPLRSQNASPARPTGTRIHRGNGKDTTNGQGFPSMMRPMPPPKVLLGGQSKQLKDAHAEARVPRIFGAAALHPALTFRKHVHIHRTRSPLEWLTKPLWASG
ncbi:unnamed protein product [Symbiodinium sp. CCMP2592]|nr:unnamed protein product [Symbiodinium sp. CCMP2592]